MEQDRFERAVHALGALLHELVGHVGFSSENARREMHTKIDRATGATSAATSPAPADASDSNRTEELPEASGAMNQQETATE